jgi:transcription elongation GreA/GreB family factor
MRHKDELETQLTRARGTDFANVRTDVVSIGTIVQATDLGANQPETFTILGAWDSDPDKGIISYLTPVAQSLLNNKVGDEVEFEFQGAKHRHRIERIEAFKAAPAPASATMAAIPAP